MEERFFVTPIVVEEEKVKRMLMVMGIEGLRSWANCVRALQKKPIFVRKENRQVIDIHEYIRELEKEIASGKREKIKTVWEKLKELESREGVRE